MVKKINFNNLSNYSNKPIKIIDSNLSKYKKKSVPEVWREFENDKWGKAYKKFRNKKRVTLNQIDSFFYNKDALEVYLHKNNFYLDSINNIEKKNIKIYSSVIQKYSNNASALVELGAGYGSKILNLSKIKGLSHLPLIAAELTNSGQNIIRLISKYEEKEVKVGYCDFRSMKIEENLIPENSIIFTSYALHYIPKLNNKIVNFFSKLKPKIVINFEPCYEHFIENKSIYNLMCAKYVLQNDYTRNLISVINNGCLKNKCKIINIDKNVSSFSNPFLPISIIEWKPNW
tara:strand:- start:5048 stop:5911 length:864 start_codon:yes stop_codon:yes gene_type:complete